MGAVSSVNMSYVETVQDVTLHKMVNNSWETIEETCRLDVMFDTAQQMHYVAAQTPSGKFPIRTYITSDIAVQYVPTDKQFHTWWIPDENNSLQAWSLMFKDDKDAANFQLAVTKAGTGTGVVGDKDAGAGGKAESTSLAVDFAAMKGELTNLRKDLLVQFKKDLETAKEEIMTALRK